jgi:hypothetical protein
MAVLRVERLGLLMALLCGAGTVAAQPIDPGWTTFRDERGTIVQYPAGVFSRNAGAPHMGVGRRLATADGRAELNIYATPNPRRYGPAAYLRRHFPESRSTLHYDRVAPNFFAVSRNKGSRILYRRCNFSDQKETLHCIDLNYPRAEKRSWDSTVTRISRSLRPLSR